MVNVLLRQPGKAHPAGPTMCLSFTSNKPGGKYDCPQCFSVCLLARLIKNACMDLDEILHVDRDMDELINF